MTEQYHNIAIASSYLPVNESVANILIHKILLQLFRNIFITLVTEVTRRLILEAATMLNDASTW